MSHMKGGAPELTFVQVDVGGAVDVMNLIDKVSNGNYKREMEENFDDMLRSHMSYDNDEDDDYEEGEDDDNDGWVDDDDEEEDDEDYDDDDDEEGDDNEDANAMSMNNKGGKIVEDVVETIEMEEMDDDWVDFDDVEEEEGEDEEIEEMK